MSKIWENVSQGLEFRSGVSAELPGKPLRPPDPGAMQPQGQAQRSCCVSTWQELSTPEAQAGQGLSFIEEETLLQGRGGPGRWLNRSYAVQPGPAPTSLPLVQAAPPHPVG